MLMIHMSEYVGAREGPACQVRWSYPASYRGHCFSTRNGHDKRAPPEESLPLRKTSE